MTRTTLKLLALCLALAAAPALPGAEQPSQAKRADIVALLEATGSLKLGQQMAGVFVAQLSQALKKSRPDIPAEMYDLLREEVDAAIAEHMPAFLDLIVPVYAKHFSHEEIRGLLAFYRSPLGAKSIRVMPVMMQEGMRLGQQWGQALAPEITRRVIERFKAEGIDLSA